ncbi:5-oxoprolinase subunit C family protein [Marinobacterium arenosum]|uniref:5-oxoprolinase subunit C family protein n=1 Tax=Marinobacterium arenosum TaxID=2862496 RepID=UPI001C9639D0|nr:biotin-dependent carboxyltransferase family protein [Marinobacterium arenosum]MBY4677880.1 biotin-dependent carboxyltransferase family protein [Marinobacterium arenosum]
MGLKVIKPGLLTTVQDCGRFGYLRLGLTCGGAMDEQAACWANHLLDNPVDAALLEITIGNVELRAERPLWLAVTGADLQLDLNGRPIAPWQSFPVAAGDRLHFGWARRGIRGYLAVAGGLQVPACFGSRSSVLREPHDGLLGRALTAGDELPCLAEQPDRQRRMTPPTFQPDYRAELVLRVILGYQIERFRLADLKQFFSSPYLLQPESDRMGYRLSGPAIRPELSGMLSEGTCYGAIQVPPDGQPIVLMKDHQSLGGYAKLGAVLSLDAFALSQRQAGTELRFAEIELAEAQRLMRAFYRFFGVQHAGRSARGGTGSRPPSE